MFKMGWLVLLLIGGWTLSAGDGYRCPPCGCGEDDKVVQEAGACGACGMTLISEKALKEKKVMQKNLGMLIFDGMELLDMTGPYEVFAKQREFKLFTVSEDGKPIDSMGLKILPDYKLEDAPHIDILFIPGGSMSQPLSSEAVMTWVKDRAEKAELVLSVCTGSYVLAKAGLLDGKEATTYHGALNDFESNYPKIKVRRDKRFVDNGKIVTSAGIASGIDMSFYVLARMFGEGRAQQTALRIEYPYNPDPTFVRAALADQILPRLDLPDGVDWTVLATEGDNTSWRIAGTVGEGIALKALTERWEEQMSAQSWQKDADGHWTFQDRDGRRWDGDLTINPHEKGFHAELTVKRRES